MGGQGGDVSDTPLCLFDFRSLRPLRSEHGSSLQPESPIMTLFKHFKGFFFGEKSKSPLGKKGTCSAAGEVEIYN